MIERKDSDDNEQQEYDIYYQGSKSTLFSLVYPLTGPQSSIFEHLQSQKIEYNPTGKHLQFRYKTKDFQNIDKQQQSVVYSSTSVSTNSNYFYSTVVDIPTTSKDNTAKKALVWRAVNRLVQMRPKVGTRTEAVVNTSNRQKQGQQANKSNTSKNVNHQQVIQQMVDENKRELAFIQIDDSANTILQEIRSAPSATKLNRNWDISKQQYMMRLCQ